MQYYSISEIADLMHMNISTLRYYDKQGLLPFVERDTSGNRQFKQADLIMINTISCLKITGMKLKDIRTYVDWVQAGMQTAPQRLEMFKEREQAVHRQIKALEYTLDFIKGKQNYYEQAIAQGTPDVCHDEKMALLNQILNGETQHIE